MKIPDENLRQKALTCQKPKNTPEKTALQMRYLPDAFRKRHITPSEARPVRSEDRPDNFPSVKEKASPHEKNALPCKKAPLLKNIRGASFSTRSPLPGVPPHLLHLFSVFPVRYKISPYDPVLPPSRFNVGILICTILRIHHHAMIVDQIKQYGKETSDRTRNQKHIVTAYFRCQPYHNTDPRHDG